MTKTQEEVEILNNKQKELNDDELNMVTGGIVTSKGDGIYANRIYRNRQNTKLYA